MPVAIQVLMEAGLERFQARAATGHNSGNRKLIAVVVRGPDKKLIGAPMLPGNLIAGRRLLSTDRRPWIELTRNVVCPTVF